MSTEEKKLDAVFAAVGSAKRELERLKGKKEFLGKLSRADIYLWDMTIDCIQRGEQILIDARKPK